MKIAYLIFAHKLPHQLIRLVKRLNVPETSFFIHVDKRAKSAVFDTITSGLAGFDNVYFVKRHASKWGQYGFVEGILSGIQTIVEGVVQFDYVFLLSGQCYPIKTNDHIQRFLEDNQGYSFIDCHPATNKLREERLVYWHFFPGKYHFVFPKTNIFDHASLDKIWNPLAKKLTLRRRLPMGFQPYWGYNWWCLNQECLVFIHEFIQGHPSYKRYFRNVFCPDEFIFQILLANSHLKDRLINNCLTYVDFTQDRVSHNPAVLKMKDLSTFMSSDKLFARKFDTAVDSEVLDRIDEALDGVQGRNLNFQFRN